MSEAMNAPAGAPDPETADAATTAETAPAADAARSVDRAGREPHDLSMAMSPSQILGGFALTAALLIMLRRRLRRRD